MYYVKCDYLLDYHLATNQVDTPHSYIRPINIGFHDMEHKSNNISLNHFEYSVINIKIFFRPLDKIQS